MKELTESQQRTYDYVVEFSKQNGRTPSLNEIKNHLGLPYASSAQHLMRALGRKGFLERSGAAWSHSPWKVKAQEEHSSEPLTPTTSIQSLADINEKKEDSIKLKDPWMNDILGGGINPGGLILLAGDPGIGKTTLTIQLTAALSQKNVETLILLSEQTIGELKRRAEGVVSDKTLYKNIKVTEGKYVEKLEEIFDQMERPNSDLSNIKVIVIDSIQGLGLVSAHRQKWEPFFKLLKRAKNRRVTVILIGHVTKLGVMAGPRALEHEVDVFIHAKKLLNFRVFFVPKNRFGPTSRTLLQMTRKGILESVARDTSTVPVAISKSYSSYIGPVEVQARVEATPWLGSGRQIANGVTRKQLVKVMGILKNLGFDFLSLQTEVQALIPGSDAMSPPDLDVPLAVSLVASYTQRTIPSDSAFVGELDLMGNIIQGHPPSSEDFDSLTERLKLMGVKKIYCHEKFTPELKGKFTILQFKSLVEIFSAIWRDLDFRMS